MKSKTLSLGGVSLIDKVEKDYGLISDVFGGIGGRARDFEGRVKLLLHNRLTHAVSVHQILETYPRELHELLGIKNGLCERSLYRTLEKIGKCYPVLVERYQDVLGKHGLVDDKQIMDFSSTYFEGDTASLGAYGYSRDKRFDKKQITFGISTGINDIPSALTIQRGNTQDKKHIQMLLNVAKRVLEPGSLLMFDAGANSRENKGRIRGMGHHYLTLKPKKITTYKKHVRIFNREPKRDFEINGRKYFCVKKKSGDEGFLYIFFSPRRFKDQIRKKERKFRRQKEKGNKLAKKALKHKALERYPSDKGWVDLFPRLQATLEELDNPYINGVEGFFILESSVDADPEKILSLYKNRDKAEKFIRSLKEGNELRPLRHYRKWEIIGAVFVCFLATAMINLTLRMSKIGSGKNVKLLKKYLMNLTLTVIYPKNRFRLRVVSNISPPIHAIFGGFVHRYGDKNLGLRW